MFERGEIGELEFVKSREGLRSIWVKPYWCQDPKNLIISLFGPFGGQFGPIFPYYPIIWGFPLGPLLAPIGSYWPLLAPIGPVRLLVVRHAQSGNKGRADGEPASPDPELTNLGYQQAEALGRELFAEPIGANRGQ